MLILAALASLTAPAATAQEIATALEAVRASGSVRPGDTIYITDASGETMKGTLADISPAGVVVDSGMLADSRRTIPAAAIERIQRADPLTNGVLIGVAAGVGIAAVSPALVCDLPDPECGWRAFGFVGVPAGVGSVVVATLLDRAIRRTVYRARPGASTTGISVAPLAAPATAGLTVRFRF